MYIPEETNEEVEDVLEDVEVDEEEADVEETEGEPADEDGGQGDPQDLADAFERLRQVDAEDAAGDVEDAGYGEGGEEEAGDIDGGDEDEGLDLAADDDGYGADGGSAVGYDAAQYQAARKNIAIEVNRFAVSQARAQFSKDGIRKFTMDDVYERQQDGRVIYRNPDDPNRPFASRMEAQQWIDSFNKQYDDALMQTAASIRNESAKLIAPSMRLLEFAPTYDAMADEVRELFDDIIEDYEVKNAKGEVVGYRCDLNRMAAKAERLAAKYNNTPRKQKSSANIGKRKAQRKPSLDMKARGSAIGSGSDREPQTMEEAMMLLRKQNRR